MDSSTKQGLRGDTMTFTDWLTDTWIRLQEDGRAAISESAYELYLGFLRRINHFISPGTPLYEREWDVLIILDACRVDVLRELTENYSFLTDVSVHHSTGSCSPEWMDTTFTDSYNQEISQTTYVTGNPFSERRLRDIEFGHLDEVWRYAWDEETGTIPPRPITDRAITAARTYNPEFLIIHYMQPHFPSIPTPLSEGISLETFDETWRSPLDQLQAGEISHQRVWKSYRKNLEYVLDDVALLLENIDADTVAITADHGEAFGEWGVYEHPYGMPLPCLRNVPWVKTAATDNETYTPTTKAPESSSTDVEDKLTALGYL